MGFKLLEEIEDWKLEAKLEDNSRYFYHTKIVDRILKGKKLYIIGRKGTGKTAITENLVTRRENGYFAQKLTFKNFPFNKLYELEDKGYNSPNQYITLWKYVIYSTTCKMLINDHSIDLTTRTELEKLFPEDISNALPSAIERWTSFKFDVKILGNGIGLGANKESKANNGSWTDRVEILEKFLTSKLKDNKYLVIFDELDEDYKDIMEAEKHNRYTQLLTSLFKAVQDIRSKFLRVEYYPIIFLRDDIYDILQDPDKTKWSDLRVDLDWDEASLKKMLAFRISRALDQNGPILGFEEAWKLIFEEDTIKVGHQKNRNMTIFNYITRSSQLRPRDYIRYLQLCSEKAVERDQAKIPSALVSEVDSAFSNHLRSELEDEIHGIIPDINHVLSLFTVLRKQRMKIEDFKTIYETAYEEGKVKTKDYQFILEILFHFSVIGNQPKQITHQVFRYKNKEARLNMKESIIVHRGLFRSLQIL
jgi:hypothetical protein